MAASSHYILSPEEFLAKACDQLEQQLCTECPRLKILKTDVLNLSIDIGESPNKGSHEESTGDNENESITVSETSGTGVGSFQLSLLRTYRECFFENIFAAEIVEGVLKQFINNSVASMVNITGTHVTLINIKKQLLPCVKPAEWVDGFNKIICTNSIDDRVVAFPMIGLPSTYISVLIDNALFRRNLTTTIIQEWCSDPDSRVLLERYAEKDDRQLGQLVEMSEASKEQVGLLKLARENLAKKIEGQKNKTAIWQKTYTECFVSDFSGQRLDFDNLVASLILLPEEISKLEVKGDHVVVVPDTNSVIVGPSRDAFSLCFLGELVLDSVRKTRHISAVPLRLVSCDKDIWKWIPYRTDLSKNEACVPRNQIEKDLIFNAFKKGLKKRDKRGRAQITCPVFIDFPTPLSLESQEEIAKVKDTPIRNVNLRCVCWQCGKGSVENLRKCKQCLLARYCGAECQKEHWKMHKKFCRMRKSENANASQVKQGY